MMTEIQPWLSNPKRDFASGVLLFNKYATKALKKSYADYFNGLDAANVKAFDAPFNILINKLTAINTYMISNPEAFKDILAAITSPQIIISNQVKEIVALKKEADVLTIQLEEHKTKAAQVEQLKADLTGKIEKINSLTNNKNVLQTELDNLADRGKAKENPEIVQEGINNTEQLIQDLSLEKDNLSTQVETLKASEDHKPEDVTTLQNQISELDNKIKGLNNDKKVLKTKLTQLETENEELSNKVTNLTNQIKSLDSEIGELTNEKDNLESDLEELNETLDQKDSDIEDLEEELEQKSTEIEQLKTDLESKGLKVVTDEDLPADLKKKRTRIKEIVPLMAKIHAELSDLTLTDDQRKSKALELCELDDERRALWDSIDEYLSGKDSLLAEDKTVEYSQDPVIRGMQIANRIKRVKENIKRNEEAVQKHIKNKKPNLELRAQNLVEGYRLELEQLESMLNDKK